MKRIRGEPERRGQIVAASRGNHPENDFREISHSVQEKLKGAIAAENEDALTSVNCSFTGFCGEIAGAAGHYELEVPGMFFGEGVQFGENFLSASAPGGRVDEQTIGGVAVAVGEGFH